jgi:hypothetical protein
VATNESHRSLSEAVKMLECKFAELEKDLLRQKLIMASSEDEYRRMQNVNTELTEQLRNERLSAN